MSIEKSAAEANAAPDRAMDTPEFIRRLAEDQRVKSGSDLPLSCFIEQIKMQLKGRPIGDIARTPPERVVKRTATAEHQTSELYRAWALGE